MLEASRGGETSIRRAAFINMISRYLAALVGVVYSIILARILSPEDFGIVAIAQVFVTFFALFQDMGLGAAIIQRQDLDPEDISQLFGFSLLLSIGLALAFCIGGIPISIIYGESRLVTICAALSLTTLFSTLNTVPNALLVKSRRFMLVGIRQIVCVLAASVLGIVSAAFGAGPYAIVVYSIANACGSFFWNYMTNRVTPVFRGMRRAVDKVFGYSAWLFGFNLVNYFSRNTDNLLVGYYFGTADLGNYSKAYQLMQYPQTFLTSVVAGVLHPMLAERQGDVDYIYEVFVKLSKALSLIGVFASVFCYFSAEEIVSVLYGEQWLSSAVCLKYLSISIWSQMVCGASGPIFRVLDSTKEQFIRGLMISMITVCATLVGISYGGIENVAKLVGIAYFAPFLLLLPYLIQRSFSRTISGYLRIFSPDLAIAIILGFALFILDEVIVLKPITALAVKLLVALMMYIVLIVAFRQVKWLAALLPARLRLRVMKMFRC